MFAFVRRTLILLGITTGLVAAAAGPAAAGLALNNHCRPNPRPANPS